MINTLAFRAMGCQMLAAIDGPPASLELVPDWFEAWEQHFSRFRPESELCAVNRRAGLPTIVSREFAQVFEAALEAHRATEGLVTPVLLEALARAGYDRSFDQLPRIQAAVPAINPLTLPSLAEITWEPAIRTITLPPDVALDFGGIAKGWAAHQSMRRLAIHSPALVDAGGDIAISGPQADGQPWDVGVANPFDPLEDLEILQLERCGVATSGRDRRRWLKSGQWNHHILDPRTGLPAKTDILTATIVAPTVMEAEQAAKACLIKGSQAGLGWIEAQPQLAALLVLEDGQRLYSQTMQNYLRS